MKKIGIISDTHGCFDQTLRDFLSEVDEIWHAGDIGSLELADRILVLCGGKVNGILDGRKTTKEEVGLRMTNLVKEEQA